MELSHYAEGFRQDLMNLISGIENSRSYANWDNTTPNYIIKNRLKDTYSRYMHLSSIFGVFIVERHSTCKRPSHSDQYVVVVVNQKNKAISYQSDDYVWSGNQITQGNKVCICPCSPNLPAEEHYVIVDVAYSKNTKLEVGNTICGILQDIHCAIDQSGDKKPRSGIREYLLRAILQLNDLILRERFGVTISEICQDKRA